MAKKRPLPVPKRVLDRFVWRADEVTVKPPPPAAPANDKGARTS